MGRMEQAVGGRGNSNNPAIFQETNRLEGTIEGGSLSLKQPHNQRLPIEEFVLSHDGLPVQEEDPLETDGFYRVTLRLRGGKGGFGSMLRMLGAQIEKTTNHEACRDLSGRRMRDVNNEKKLADWIAKKADREREREERIQAKLERLRSEPRHRFVDPNYHKQKNEVSESLDEAITQGIQVSVDEPSTSSREKRKHDDDDEPGSSKRGRLWVGVEDGSDSDDSDSEGEMEIPLSSESEEPQRTEDPTRLEEEPSREVPSSSSHSSPTPDTTPTSTNQDPPSSSPERNASSEAVVVGAPETVSTGDSGGEAEQNGADEDQSKIVDKAGEAEFSLDAMESLSELEAFGLERLKTELMARGLKCGGTLQERTQRLFSVKGLTQDQIDSSLKAKSGKGKRKQKSK